MIGQTVSHYRIVKLLGAGGMGVVYQAEDARLKRPVALKFLPVELTLDRQAKERLIQEAQAASSLDHPNICTIHEIDETPDGRTFLAMAYYEGETLRQRIARGPLGLDQALDLAEQIARGVAAAHDAGIVHRDIKPGNIMVTQRGEVKLLDFGLAKLVGQTGLTRTGTTVGTIAYMAPEQISGLGADQRADVWALGMVLYEMLAGRLPFSGEHEIALMNAVVNHPPRRLRDEQIAVPAEIDALVARALEKDPAARHASAREFLTELSAARAALTAPVPQSAAAPRSPVMRRGVVLVVALGAIALAALGGWPLYRDRDVRWARDTALPEIKRLIAQDNHVAAFGLARNAERVLKDDAVLAGVWSDLSMTRSFQTNPPAATVYIRDAALRSDWQLVGTTPLENVRIPIGMVRWKVEKPGYETEEFVAVTVATSRGIGLPGTLELTAAGNLPRGMVKIPAGDLGLTLTGYDYNQTIAVAEYLIDKYEVTNKDFKEFIDAGGYQQRQYWTHAFVEDGRVLSWDDALARFRDQTGRPGPSTWEVGTYPRGQDDYPVGGISWYEASAYAQFRGKSLPTVYHWLGAAGTNYFAAGITPSSNFGGSPVSVGHSQAVSTFGLYDVAGNVKEWCWNEMEPGSTRYILGGGWNEADYMFIFPDARSSFDRSAQNGFRLVEYSKPESLPADATRAIARPTRNYRDARPVSDEIFRVYQSLYANDPAPLAAAVDRVDDRSEIWRKERVSFRAAYGNERVIAYLFIPTKATPPFQSILFWPGSTSVRSRSSDNVPGQSEPINFLAQSGRAVLYPVYHGTYERSTDRQSTWPDTTRAYREWVMKQVSDARRSLDYLETRPDIRHDVIGFLGISWGARMGSLVLAQEPRLRAAVLTSGGFSPGDAPPEVDPLNFAPRVSVPVLMLNGDHDSIYEVELSQKPLFRFLGTPPDRKRHLLFPGGHGVFIEQRSQVIRETLDWFDRYLGPVQ